MNILKSIKNLFQVRNYAVSDSFVSKMGQPVYTDWTLSKVVKDGYKVNGWVYRAINLIANSASSVEWETVGEDGEPIEDHHLTQLIQSPNKYISRQDLFQLCISWLELTGNAYLKKVQAGGKTVELWPISPDRLAPVPSKDVTEWLKGYSLDKSGRSDFEPDEIIHLKYFNPANPLIGLSPLAAISKTIDLDNSQRDWNQSAMQNRGVLDGVFSFKREFRSQEETDMIAEKLNERYGGSSNARRIGIVGSEAQYIRTAATPVEMDFANSYKANRDQIFIVLGIPPQYAGTQESSTFNNYSTSELIFWFQTVIPLLDDIKSTFNFYFKDELGQNEKIHYKLNSVPAIRRALLEKTETAKNLFAMGVPFEQLNRIFEIGIQEYEGWEKSHVAKGQDQADEIKEDNKEDNKADEINSKKKNQFETRDINQEMTDREDMVIEQAEIIEGLFAKQDELIQAAITKNSDGDKLKWIDADTVLEDSWEDWRTAYNTIATTAALQAANDITVEERATAEEEIAELIENYLMDESIVLTELSYIENTTVLHLMDQVEDAIDNAWTATQLQQAIIDVGVFSAERALMLSRTIVGTAASIGQITSAQHTGAKFKHWNTAKDSKVRFEHSRREAQGWISIDEPFEGGAMYPLDPVLPPADRVNCRCAMTFKM